MNTDISKNTKRTVSGNERHMMEQQQKEKTLGVLGGLGPMASVYFYELLTAHTDASCDQEHINLVLSSHAQTPDRSDYITGKSRENPLPVMLRDAQKLEAWGVDMIAIPCNTAHFFYDALQDACRVPILNIMEENVRYLHSLGVKRAGILATDGTVQSGAYDRHMEKYGITPVVPDAAHQKMLMHIIFDQIKQGVDVDCDLFAQIASHMKAAGCEKVILGCTELSLIPRSGETDRFFIDSMEVLVLSVLQKFGMKIRDFDL